MYKCSLFCNRSCTLLSLSPPHHHHSLCIPNYRVLRTKCELGVYLTCFHTYILLHYYTRRWDVHILQHPRVCSHTWEVEFDSQPTPSNTTFGRCIAGSHWSSVVDERLTPVLVRLTSCQTTVSVHTPAQAPLVGGQNA